MDRAAEEQFESVEARLARELEWSECDGAGIIYYPTYFRWMDAATWAFVRAVGYDAERMRAERRVIPQIRAQCQFLIAAKQADRCEIRSRVTGFGEDSFALSHEIARGDGAVLARGMEVRRWGRQPGGPGTAIEGETISEAFKALFRAR